MILYFIHTHTTKNKINAKTKTRIVSKSPITKSVWNRTRASQITQRLQAHRKTDFVVIVEVHVINNMSDFTSLQFLQVQCDNKEFFTPSLQGGKVSFHTLRNRVNGLLSKWMVNILKQNWNCIFTITKGILTTTIILRSAMFGLKRPHLRYCVLPSLKT